MTALAYFNWGRWVVDCPYSGCTDSRKVRPPRLEDVCANGHPFTIVMPPERDAEAIASELLSRPYPTDQAWYPAGHVRAELAGQPTGQTVADLRKETREVAERRAERQATKDRLAAVLAEHGITVDATGTFSGRL